MATQTQFYLRDTTPSGYTLPSGYLGTWTNTSATSKRGANARATGSAAGSSATTSASSSTTNTDIALAQFVTPKLAAQSISSGNWTAAIAAAGGSVSAQRKGRIGIYLINGATGAIRTTIAALVDFGGLVSNNSGRTDFATTVAGGSATVTDGDYILFEIGINKNSGVAGIATLYYDGATAVTTDNAVSTTPASYVSAPAALTLSVLGAVLSGGSAGASAVAGSLKTTSRFNGATVGVATVAASLKTTSRMNAASAGAAAVAATRIKLPRALSGATAGAASTAANLKTVTRMNGATAGAASVAGTRIRLPRALSGGTAGASAVAGTLRTQVILRGSSVGVGAVNALRIALSARPLAGASVGVASVAAVRLSGAPAVLTGASQGAGSASARLRIGSFALTGTTVGQGVAGAARIALPHALRGRSSGAATVGGDWLSLHHAGTLYGGAVGAATVNAVRLNLTVRALWGATSGQGVATAAHLRLPHALSGGAVGAALVSAPTVVTFPSVAGATGAWGGEIVGEWAGEILASWVDEGEIRSAWDG